VKAILQTGNVRHGEKRGMHCARVIVTRAWQDESKRKLLIDASTNAAAMPAMEIGNAVSRFSILDPSPQK